jgi:outer membrane protein assembly factor BamD
LATDKVAVKAAIMKMKQARQFALLLLAAVALPLSGCAGRKVKKDTSYVARDVNSLYATAKDKLDRGEFKLAAALFDEVERQHPYSAWARRAQLMSAFSYYMGRDYTESTSSAQRFLSIHPGNRDAPYAYYLVALDSFGELIRRYPTSRYAADARLKVDLVQDHLAGKEMEIGRFYQRRGSWLASVVRFRRVVEDYNTTSHTPEALMRLTESYMALGIPEEAKKAAAVLGHNYPGSKWYERAFELVQKNIPAA